MSVELTEEKKKALIERISRLSTPKEPIPTELQPNLKKLQDIKGVFVDVYGTIMISGTEPMLRRNGSREINLLTKTFNDFGIQYREEAVSKAIELLHAYIDEEHAIKKAEGVDYPEVEIIPIWIRIMKELEESKLIDGFDTEIAPDFITDFVIRYDDPWLMPGLEELMAGLKDKDMITGIISNSSFYTPPTLEALSGRSLEEMGFPEENCFWSFAEDIAKPSVAFYEIAADHIRNTLNGDPSEFLFVGNDLLNDMYPAQQVGFKTAFFAGDKRSLRLREGDARCENLTPDITITHLTQILQCI